MLSFHVKSVQTDRWTDRRTDGQTMVKQYAPIKIIMDERAMNPVTMTMINPCENFSNLEIPTRNPRFHLQLTIAMNYQRLPTLGFSLCLRSILHNK